MDRERARLIRADEAVIPAAPTPGMVRRELYDDGSVWIGRVQTEPGISSGWHYHGDRTTYIFVLEGRIRIDFGPGGRESVEGGPGDLIINPARMVHRETTPSEAVDGVVIRIGSGPQNVNVEGPDPD
ncbi:MAG TPA: cupin domain-containing protein [Candidatus Deferrimicrobiaceae bacterium]|nr:cupin domain-containing protein [Candidatus Deferrimicrobiaceae bacterium]